MRQFLTTYMYSRKDKIGRLLFLDGPIPDRDQRGAPRRISAVRARQPALGSPLIASARLLLDLKQQFPIGNAYIFPKPARGAPAGASSAAAIMIWFDAVEGLGLTPPINQPIVNRLVRNNVIAKGVVPKDIDMAYENQLFAEIATAGIAVDDLSVADTFKTATNHQSRKVGVSLFLGPWRRVPTVPRPPHAPPSGVETLPHKVRGNRIYP